MTLASLPLEAQETFGGGRGDRVEVPDVADVAKLAQTHSVAAAIACPMFLP